MYIDCVAIWTHNLEFLMQPYLICFRMLAGSGGRQVPLLEVMIVVRAAAYEAFNLSSEKCEKR